MTIWALIPVKSLDHAKSRLCDVLTVGERSRLIGAMLDDVVSHLAQVPEIAGVALVTREPAAFRPSLRRIEDPGRGLNAAVAHAARVLQGEGATAVLVIPADTPLTTPQEIRGILAAGRKAQVVVVPNLHQTGTNGLMLSPPMSMLPAFGKASFARHMARAGRLGIAAAALPLPGLGFDVDSPHDLTVLRVRLAHRRAYEFLRPHAQFA